MAGFRESLGKWGGRMLRAGFCAGAIPVARTWAPHSRLILLSDTANWVLSWEAREIGAIARRLGIRVAHPAWLRAARGQCVFNANHYFLLDERWLGLPHRMATCYFHGRPGGGVEEFDRCYENLRRRHERLERIQVSHSEMRDVVLSSGIAPEKVFLIPIGINLSLFRPRSLESRRAARARYGLPQSAAVIGSFQKDGVGWGEGWEPKWVKGPDVFLRAVEVLKSRVPELWVFLSGPARGYVKKGLKRLGVPHVHHYVRHYPEVGEMFQALDVYIVASRQEGGPKAVLESMASGVPLVTTRVGQAMDLVKHGENGWMVEVEDAEGLAHWAEFAIRREDESRKLAANARTTAEAHSYEAQTGLWREFMRGFVAFGGSREEGDP